MPPRKAPLKRGTSELKRTPLARIGRKAKSKAYTRAKVCKIVRARDVHCVWHWHYATVSPQPAVTLEEATCGGRLDVHEICPRTVWPDGDLDPTNCALLCRRHHHWLDAHRDIAVRMGLYRRSKP